MNMKNLELRLRNAVRKANIFKGPATVAAITEQLPAELLERLYSSDIALILEAIDKAYKRGKASSGAEMIDTDCVWIDSLNRGIEWREVGAEYEMQSTEKTSMEGLSYKVSRSVKVKDGELVANFI